MKQLLLAFLLVCGSLSCLEAKLIKVESTKCYCSDLCGPRDIKPDDAPYVDQETAIFFCKPRDKKNYEPNACATKPCDKQPGAQKPAKRKVIGK